MPFFLVRVLTEGDEHDEPFLVLASDGLWDVLSNDEVARLARKVG